MFVNVLSIVSTTVAIKKRNTVLVEGWFALDIQSLIEEAEPRRISSMACKNLEQHVFRLRPCFVIKQQFFSFSVDLWSIDSKNSSNTLIVQGRRWYNARYAFAEISWIVVQLLLNVSITQSVALQRLHNLFKHNWVKHEPSATERNIEGLLAAVVHTNFSTVHEMKSVAQYSTKPRAKETHTWGLEYHGKINVVQYCGDEHVPVMNMGWIFSELRCIKHIRFRG